MFETIILTRNFLQKTAAKYCALVWGADPKSAVETDNILLKDVREIVTTDYEETEDLEDMGCGLVLVGQGVLNHRPVKPPKRAELVKWDGLGFAYPDGDRFREASRVVATPKGLFVK